MPEKVEPGDTTHPNDDNKYIFTYVGPFDVRIITQVISLHQNRSIVVKRFKDSLDDDVEIYVY